MPLAQPGDPLVTINGLLDDVKSKHKTDPVQRLAKAVATVPDVSGYMARTRRSVNELPAPAYDQSVINCVLVYVLLGMTTNEIAHLLKVEMSEIQAIRSLAAFQETFAMIFNELLSMNSASLQARIAAFTTDAVENVMTIASGEIDPDYLPAKVKLDANKDLLDRAGMSPDALFGKNKEEDNQTLKIEVISTGGESASTKVNINFSRKR